MNKPAIRGDHMAQIRAAFNHGDAVFPVAPVWRLKVLEFCRNFREFSATIPIAVVPSSYSSVYESELVEAGVNVVIYANQLLRSAFPAMKRTAESILDFVLNPVCSFVLMRQLLKDFVFIGTARQEVVINKSILTKYLCQVFNTKFVCVFVGA